MDSWPWIHNRTQVLGLEACAATPAWLYTGISEVTVDPDDTQYCCDSAYTFPVSTGGRWTVLSAAVNLRVNAGLRMPLYWYL